MPLLKRLTAINLSGLQNRHLQQAGNDGFTNCRDPQGIVLRDHLAIHVRLTVF
ncbi:hypothetical protein [Legionella sainthelensi]|uniref:hypothetical protein n=1 Tax=Legionella sainthelensi TaxID=28087 RepID=UPI000A7F4263|nr:hypothetical protein [Legionella sainthelensi]